MKLYVAILLAGILSVSGLSGCGAGGGNPGACLGSAEVCEGNNSSTVPQNTAVPDQPGALVTCASFATQQEAQAAFAAGATQLDSNGDGLACNE
jgi:hypothetical protein